MHGPLPLLAAGSAILLASCTYAPGHGDAQSAVAAPQPSEGTGLAFIEAACSGCHDISPPGLSPNMQAPTFEAIANIAGLTRPTLAGWLTDAHNYPEVMDFDLDPEQIEMIADYMLTLRKDDYTPPPS